MTSSSYRNVGLTQFLLALGFVIWLVFLPGFAGHFAWPIGSRLSSMFIGTSFALRCFEGFRMWREPNWSRLRWMSWGTMAFLTFIFAATYWHVDQINWAPLNIAAIIWMIAYTAEPLVIPFVEPRGSEANMALPRSEQRTLSNGLQNALTIVMFIAATLLGMFFINPAKFITNYWPWPVTPFDARIMSSFFAGIVFWVARMKALNNWPEIRMGMQGLILFFGGHFLVWIFNLVTGQFDPVRSLATWVYGIVMGMLAILLLLFYLQPERK
jgi:hypothetical protein